MSPKNQTLRIVQSALPNLSLVLLQSPIEFILGFVYQLGYDDLAFCGAIHKVPFVALHDGFILHLHGLHPSLIFLHLGKSVRILN